MSEEPRQNGKPKSGLVQLSGIGVELVGAVAGFTLAGYWWDRHYGTGHWGILTGAVLGLVGGMYNLIRQSLNASRSQGGGNGTTDTTEKDGRT
jgi:F0F1-type ATP synthase assembly protein I